MILEESDFRQQDHPNNLLKTEYTQMLTIALTLLKILPTKILGSAMEVEKEILFHRTLSCLLTRPPKSQTSK